METEWMRLTQRTQNGRGMKRERTRNGRGMEVELTLNVSRMEAEWPLKRSGMVAELTRNGHGMVFFYNSPVVYRGLAGRLLRQLYNFSMLWIPNF